MRRDFDAAEGRLRWDGVGTLRGACIFRTDSDRGWLRHHAGREEVWLAQAAAEDVQRRGSPGA